VHKQVRAGLKGSKAELASGIVGQAPALQVVRSETTAMHGEPHKELAARSGLRFPDCVGAWEADVSREEQSIRAAGGELSIDGVLLDHLVWHARLELDRGDKVPKL
jgi:hypothetical protein